MYWLPVFKNYGTLFPIFWKRCKPVRLVISKSCTLFSVLCVRMRSMCAWSVRLRADAPVRMRTCPPPSVRDPQCPNSPPFSGIPRRRPLFSSLPSIVADPGSGAFLALGSGIRCLFDILNISVEISSRFSVLHRKSFSLKWGLFKLFYLFFSTTSCSKRGCLDSESWVLIWIHIPHWIDSPRSGSVLEMRIRIQAHGNWPKLR